MDSAKRVVHLYRATAEVGAFVPETADAGEAVLANQTKNWLKPCLIPLWSNILSFDLVAAEIRYPFSP
jgi:hypothetical protein